MVTHYRRHGTACTQHGMRMKNTARPRGSLKCTQLIARNCFPDFFLPVGALNRTPSREIRRMTNRLVGDSTKTDATFD